MSPVSTSDTVGPHTPSDRSELAGPTHGGVRLPGDIGWTGRTTYDLDQPADRNVFYERVLVEATSIDTVTALLDQTRLRSSWTQLFLPAPVRRVWERRFPDLATAA